VLQLSEEAWNFKYQQKSVRQKLFIGFLTNFQAFTWNLRTGWRVWLTIKRLSVWFQLGFQFSLMHILHPVIYCIIFYDAYNSSPASISLMHTYTSPRKKKVKFKAQYY